MHFFAGLWYTTRVVLLFIIMFFLKEIRNEGGEFQINKNETGKCVKKMKNICFIFLVFFMFLKKKQYILLVLSANV